MHIVSLIFFAKEVCFCGHYCSQLQCNK